jgi:hypothetical protein
MEWKASCRASVPLRVSTTLEEENRVSKWLLRDTRTPSGRKAAPTALPEREEREVGLWAGSWWRNIR